jgi:uncharacterized protein
MDFEFDPDKSAANKIKHGIDFVESQLLWADMNLLEVPARTDGEPRFLAIGKIGGKHWAAIYTMRGTVIRLISVRRARNEEVQFYENE